MRTENNFTPSPKGFLSINEVALLLPNSKTPDLIHRRKNVYNLIKKGKWCPKWERINGRIFFVEKDFKEWLKGKK